MWVGDIEADGFLDEATQVWCGVFKNIETGVVEKFYPGMAFNHVEAMLTFLDQEVDSLVMHNGIGYDFPLLRKLHGYEFKGEKIDTLLMSRLQNPNRKAPAGLTRAAGPHSVEAWGLRFGVEKPKHEEWDRYTPAMLYRCEQDVEIQCLIYQALLEEANEGDWDPANRLTARLFDNLRRQQEYGWYVDQPHIDHCLYTLNKWIGRIDKAVEDRLPLIIEVKEQRKDGRYTHVKKPFLKNGSPSKSVQIHYPDYDGQGGENFIGGPFSRISIRRISLDKPLELKNLLLSQGWQPLEWNKNSEGKRTSPKLSIDDPWVGVKDGIGKLVAKRVQCKQRRSVIEGWKESIRPDGRIPSIVTGLAVTGRAKHKGIANVPRPTSFFGKWMRQIFICKPGWVLVGADSEGNQLRQLAARMGDPRYIDAVCNQDPHSFIQHLCNLPERSMAKTLQYGVIFGAGDAKTGKIVKGTKEAGAKLKALLFKGLPGLAAAIDKLTAEWKANATQTYNSKWNRLEYKNGWFKGLDGRKIFCEHEHAVLNYALQSDEAIQMAAAYNIFHKWAGERGFKIGVDFGVVCWYHDEFTSECRPEIAEEIKELKEKSIEWAGKFYNIQCPHKGKGSIGHSWADIH